MPKDKETKRWVSVSGHDYSDKDTGDPVRVEPGEEIVGMPDSGLKNEIEQGNITEMGKEDS